MAGGGLLILPDPFKQTDSFVLFALDAHFVGGFQLFWTRVHSDASRESGLQKN
jgi:hypothetical protein